MAKRSVTIRAAQITGACTIVAAMIVAVVQCPSLRPPGVENSPRPVGDDLSRDSNAFDVVDASEPVASYDGSFGEYVGRLAALKDRNLERQEFLHSMEGKRVVWRGWVTKVADVKGMTVVSISPSREGSAIECMGVYFPPLKWRTKLYALRNGDQVEVDAIYEDGTLLPFLRGLSVSLVDAE